MKVSKIIYGKSFEMYGYWEKINLEIEVEGNETPEKVLDQAKYIVDQWHQANPASVYDKANRKPMPEEVRYDSAKPKTRIESIIDLINAATSMKELDLYQNTVNNNYESFPELKEAYNKKLDEIKN